MSRAGEATLNNMCEHIKSVTTNIEDITTKSNGKEKRDNILCVL